MAVAPQENVEQLVLSAQEQALVASLPPLLFSEVPWEPLSVVDDSGAFAGVIADYLDVISEEAT